MKKSIELFGLICILVLFSACIGYEKDEAAAENVNINVDGVYEITDENELDTTLNTTYTSTDSSVAVLRSGKYICGLRPGKTRIKVDHDGIITNYDVIVASNNKDSRKFEVINGSYSKTEEKFNYKYIDNNDIMFGYCFNVLEGKELNQDAIGSECVFDWDAVLKSDNIRVDNSENMEFTSYSGSTLNSFYDSYKSKETVKVTAKLGKIKLFDKTFEKYKNNKTLKEEMQNINQLYWKHTKASYFFQESDYEKYLKDDVKASLMGTDGTTVENFIKKYGTHIIVGGCYGGTFEMNYNLEDEKLIEQNAEVINSIKLHLNPNILYSAYNDTLHDKSFAESIRKFAYKQIFKESFSGGKIVDCDAYIMYNSNDYSVLVDCTGDFRAWLIGMSVEDGEWRFFGKNNGMSNRGYIRFETKYCYISPINEQSLIPVWELIDTDTQAGKDRKKAFVDYIKKV